MKPVVTLTPSGLRDPTAGAEGETATLIEPDSISALGPYLWRPIRLATAYTLGDLVRMIDHRDLELLEWMLACSIRPYLEEIEAAEAEPRPTIEYLRIVRHAQAPPDVEGLRSLRLTGYLEGWGRWGEDEDGAIYGLMAIEHVPPAELMGIDLRLEPELRLPSEVESEGFRGPIAIRLVELLRAVFRTLDTFGSPDRRRAARQAMEAQIEDADSIRDGGNGIRADSVQAYLHKLAEREGREDSS